MEDMKKHKARTESGTTLPKEAEDALYPSTDSPLASTGAEPATSNGSSFKEDVTGGRRYPDQPDGSSPELRYVGFEFPPPEDEIYLYFPAIEQPVHYGKGKAGMKRRTREMGHGDGALTQNIDDETLSRKKHAGDKDDSDDSTIGQAEDADAEAEEAEDTGAPIDKDE